MPNPIVGLGALIALGGALVGPLYAATYSGLCSPFSAANASATVCRVSDYEPTYAQDVNSHALICVPPATGEDVHVSMMGFCSSSSSVSSTASFVPTISTTTDANNYCLCQMTEPVLSAYVVYGRLSTTLSCMQTCTQRCVDSMISSAAFRQKIFATVLLW